MLKLNDWWKDVLVKIVLVYSLFRVAVCVSSIVQIFLKKSSPLIPDHLYKYISFSNCFLIAIWLLILFLSFKLIRSEKLLKKWFMHLFIGTIIYQFLVEIYLYRALGLINPYG